MVKVHRVRLPNSDVFRWTVIGNDYLPIDPAESYLKYIHSHKSPNTVRAYAGHIKLFWEFLEDSHLSYQEITLEHLSKFIEWLRDPLPGAVHLHPQQDRRVEKSINTILTAVLSFYRYQMQIGQVSEKLFKEPRLLLGSRYKPFLHHVSKGKDVNTRILKIKEPRRFPGCLSQDKVKEVVEGASHFLFIEQRLADSGRHNAGLRLGAHSPLSIVPLRF